MEGWTDDTGSDNFQSQNLAKIARGGYDYHAKLGRNNTDDKTVLPRNKEGVEDAWRWSRTRELKRIQGRERRVLEWSG